MATPTLGDHHARRRHRRMDMKVSRPVYTERAFQQGYEEMDLDQSLASRLRKAAGRRRRQCTLEAAGRCLAAHFPVVKWLPRYEVRRDLLHDIIAGFTVGILRIPQAMAYALLAGLPPVYGLYVAFFGTICYTVMGTSRHISTGTFAVVCIMTGQAVDRVLGEGGEGNDIQRVYVASVLATAVGIIQLLMGMLRLGFITIYLSEPLVRGFTTGAAVHVFSSQFRHLFGVSVPRSTGPFSLVKSYISFCGNLSQANLIVMLTSAVSMLFLVGINEVQDFVRHRGTYAMVDGVRQQVRKPRKKIPIPSELFVIILGTVASYFGHFEENYGVTVVGEIPTGIPPPRVPQLSYFSLVLGDAFTIAIVSYAVSISVAKILAKQHKYEVDPNQELLAFGVCQIFGSFFNCFPMAGSLSRSVVQEVSGGKTQVAGLLSCIIVVLVLFVIGPLFSALPRCCLAAIISVALAGMFRQLKDLILLWQVSTYDFLIWVVTFLAVVLVGVDIGLAMGVVFSLMTVIVRTQQPYCTLMGRIPGTDIYRDMNYYGAAEEIPGIRIFRAHSCLCFVNAEYFKNSLYSKVFKKKSSPTAATISQENGNTVRNGGQTIHPVDEEALPVTEPSPAEGLRPAEPVHTVIIDCGMFSFVDMVGLKTLHAVVTHCIKMDAQVVFASCKAATREALLKYFERCSDQPLGLDHMYLTLHDAVLHSSHLPMTPTNSLPEEHFPAAVAAAAVATISLDTKPAPLVLSESSV